MGTLNTSGKNVALDALAAVCTYAALLDASLAEISGGSPAYARKAITFDSAAAGAVALASTYEFNVPAGETIAHVAYYTASSGGTQHTTDAVTNEAYTGQGTYTLTSGTMTLSDS